MRNVLIVGNSMSLPPEPGIEAYPERMAARLREEWRVRTLIRSGATIEEMEPDILTALESRPEALVLQVGINECAPRPLAPEGRRRLGALKPAWLRDRIIGLIHRWRPQIIRWRSLAQFTPLDRFAASVASVVDAARRAGAKVLILPVTEVTAMAEARTPFTNREIARYNRALADVAGDGATFVDPAMLLPGLTPPEYCHGPETVHWSGMAHQRVAECLAALLSPSNRSDARERSAVPHVSERS